MSLRLPALVAGLSLLSLPLGGCYDNPEHFAEKVSKHECKRMRECNRAQFEDRYDGDLGRCRDDLFDFVMDAHDIAEDFGCDYIPEEAQECAVVRRSVVNDCSDDADDDIADACDRVYQDCLRGGSRPLTTEPAQLASEPNASFDPDDDDKDPPGGS